MNVLVLNSGSSTLKFQLISTDGGGTAQGPPGQQKDLRMCRGVIEWAGGEAVITVQTSKGPRQKFTASLRDPAASLQYLVQWMHQSGITEHRAVTDIEAVGHRIVHGGELFGESTVITDEVLKGIE